MFSVAPFSVFTVYEVIFLPKLNTVSTTVPSVQTKQLRLER